ncbi:MAG: hypothetical protein NTZ44_04095 [Candidatus Nomurabacteria bacterium]|nr:hypothetical protein [Candidatus Nomurabacteria bacterium]
MGKNRNNNGKSHPNNANALLKQIDRNTDQKDRENLIKKNWAILKEHKDELLKKFQSNSPLHTLVRELT